MPVDPVIGTENNDTLTGTDGSDTLIGLGGDDSLTGDLGDDELLGGAGNDTLRGGYGDDTLEGGDGNDELEGLYGDDLIDAGEGDDHVFGRDGDDVIYGRGGNDELIGSMGTDTIYGGSGNDRIAGSQGNDEIRAGVGDDLVFIGRNEDSDRIYLGRGNDTVDGSSADSAFYATGGNGDDLIEGGAGDDTLLGGSGNDTLDGGRGNDLLTAGGDGDVVTGGLGDDVFLLQDVPGSLLITDFGANGAADLIDLSALTGYDSAEAVSAGMTFGPYQSTLNLNVTGGELVVTILHPTPLTAADLGLAGTLTGTDTGEGPASFDGDETEVEEGLTYTLSGADAALFVVDAETGDVSTPDWFTPSVDQVWDTDRDNIYEVTVIGTDPGGAEISQQHLELVVTQEGALWQEAVVDPTDPEEPVDADTYQGPDAEGVSYALSGADATLFEVDPATGNVTPQDWFTPNYDELWDFDRDHIYEMTLTGTDAAGDPVSAQNIELVVSPEGTLWQDAGDAPVDPEVPPGEDTFEGPDVDGVTYALSGPDAALFVIDAETGDVSYPDWFTPNYDEVWDVDRDHIYEMTVIGTDAAGAQVSLQNIELVVGESDTTWQDAGDAPVDPEDPIPEDIYEGPNADGVSYALSGADAALFLVDADTGNVSTPDWFTPNYDEVWDFDRDHIYEMTLIGTDAAGAQVSLQHIELVVGESDTTWQDAGDDLVDPEVPPGEDTFAGPDVEGVRYALSGQDAALFVIDAETGDVSYPDWFTPNYDEVWDFDRDHIYELTLTGTDAEGAQVSQQDIELVVTPEGALWQEVGAAPEPVEAAPYLNGAADVDLLNTFDAAADLYIDAQGNPNAPIFDGSIDWHSSVHAHLANVAAFEANGDQAGLQAFADARYGAQDVQGEIDLTFNDPYGWAWMLKLDTRLQDNGIDNLAPAGEHFAAELEANLSQQIAAGTSDNGAGSYNDANWKIANLIQYAHHQGDPDAEARYLQMFEQIQADTNLSGETSIAAGDFFSALSLSGYAHVVAGATDTALFQDIHDQMLQSVTDGTLDQLLDTEGARLDDGIGFSHSAGIAISSAYGYWALFAETENPAFYDAYANVMEWTETYADQMAESIAPGHWLPNFSSFAADLPSQIPVEDLDGSLTEEIEAWAADNLDPVDPEVPGEVLTGDALNNALTGGAGDDRLDGLGGKDTLDGGAGDDTLLAGFDDGTGDVFIGGQGEDTYDIASSSVSQFAFNIDLAAGSDQYNNSYSGIENILGGSGNDSLSGDAEDNFLSGGGGDDLLSGGAGDDTLAGGAGDDIFALTADEGSLQITDFGLDADQIDVSALALYFPDPQDLMSALSFSDGVTTFDVDLTEGTLRVAIQSQEELEEQDFLF